MASKRGVLLLFLGDPTTDRRVQNFHRLFSEAGWDIELLTVSPKHLRGPRKFLEYHRRLATAVRSRTVDVVIACDLYSLSAASWMRRRGRTTIAIYDAREVYTELPSVANRPIIKMIWKSLEHRGLKHTDLILVTAPHDLQAILDVHHFVPRSLMIRNLPWRNPSLQRDRSLLKEFGIPEGAIVFVYVGGLQRGRGLEVFLRAMSGTIIHFLIIGRGDLGAQMEITAKDQDLIDRVHFAGSRESTEALRLAAACDVGVVLIEPIAKSYELALPSKVFEYMMAGIPILSSRMRHVTELFGQAPWITYADVADIASIREGIVNVASQLNNSEMSRQERELAHETFHFEADAALLISLLDRRLQSA